MVDENFKDELLADVQAMQEELALLKQPRFLLFTGMLSYVLFLVTVLQANVLMQGVAVLGYLVTLLCWIPLLVVAFKQEILPGLIGVVLLAVGFVLLWMTVFQSSFFWWMLVGVYGVVSFLALLALGVSYVVRSKLHVGQLVFVWLCATTLLLASYLYDSAVVFLLFFGSVAALIVVTVLQWKHARLVQEKNWLQKKRER